MAGHHDAIQLPTVAPPHRDDVWWCAEDLAYELWSSWLSSAQLDRFPLATAARRAEWQAVRRADGLAVLAAALRMCMVRGRAWYACKAAVEAAGVRVV